MVERVARDPEQLHGSVPAAGQRAESEGDDFRHPHLYHVPGSAFRRKERVLFVRVRAVLDVRAGFTGPHPDVPVLAPGEQQVRFFASVTRGRNVFKHRQRLDRRGVAQPGVHPSVSPKHGGFARTGTARSAELSQVVRADVAVSSRGRHERPRRVSVRGTGKKRERRGAPLIGT